MKRKSYKTRQTIDLFVKLISGFSAMSGVFFLGWILYVVAAKGIPAFNYDFFTELPAPPGMEGGGLANAIVGTLIMTVLATIVGVFLGLMTGVYLAEFGGDTRLGSMVRFTSNVLMGMPSIIIGIFVYALVVVKAGHFSGYAGALALAIIMLPVVARTAEDMLNMVPNELRESALAMGAPRWKATFGIVFKSAKVGLLTGSLLAVARVSGETAPLLFTALNSPYWMQSLGEPTANLTVTIFNYAMSPYADWQRMAWGASLLIMAGVLMLTVCARLVFKESDK